MRMLGYNSMRGKDCKYLRWKARKGYEESTSMFEVPTMERNGHKRKGCV